MDATVSSLLWSILLLVVVIGVDLVTEDYSKAFSKQLLVQLEPYTNSFVELIIYISIYLAYYLIDLFIYLGLYFRRNKRESFNIFIIFFLTQILVQLMKIFYHDTRPCFESFTFSVEKGCTCSFGKPSSVITEIMLYYYFIYHTFFIKKDKSNAQRRMFFIFYIVLCVATIYYTFFFAQYYLNSIVVSTVLGYSLIKFYKYFDKKQYVNFLFNLPIKETAELNEKKELVSSEITLSNEQYQKKKNIIINSIIVFMILSNLIAWFGSTFIVEFFEENPYHPYSQRVCDEKCFKGNQYLSY